jgi:hypothetical protein
MTQDPDPVGNGFVASLARPGRNIMGLSTQAPEISGKQLELLKDTVPKLSRVAVFGTSTVPGHALSLREIGLVTGAFNIQLQYLDVLGPQDMEMAFRAASKESADALIVLSGATSVLSKLAFWILRLRAGCRPFTQRRKVRMLVVSFLRRTPSRSRPACCNLRARMVKTTKDAHTLRFTVSNSSRCFALWC